MKKWEAAELNCLDISETAHQWKLDFKWDGGYIGDGKISGWGGGNPTPTPTPTPTPSPEPTPDPVDFTS